MPKNVLKMIQNDLLYSNKKVAIYGINTNRRSHYRPTAATAGNRQNKNLTDKVTKLQEQLTDEYVYRIPLKFLYNLGLVNQCFKFNTK